MEPTSQNDRSVPVKKAVFTDHSATDRRKARVAWLSVTSNTLLVAAKLVVGLVIGSVAVISEAIHSAIDLVAAIIALVAVRQSGKPADEEHPFGHGKVENISGAIEAVLIFFAAGWIVFEAVEKLRTGGAPSSVGLGFVVMAMAAIVNFWVSRILFRVGRETDSVALQADAWHLRTDVWTSVGVMVGLAAIFAGERLFPGVRLGWLDPVAAICVALLIVKAAYGLTAQAVRDIMDARLPVEEERWIRDTISEHHPVVAGFHSLRTRKAGAVRFIDFHIQVNSAMSVAESHDVAMHVTHDLQEHFPGSSVHVHVEPCAGCTPRCEEGCLLPADERARRRLADHSLNEAP